MNKLVCTREFLNDLIKESIVEPRGDGVFVLYSKANLKGECYSIELTCDHNVTVNTEDISDVIPNDSKSLEQWYHSVRSEFPINAAAHLGLEGRNLRNGVKSTVKRRIQKLIDESYNLTAVIQAIQYEIWWRKKESTIDNNKLNFMKGLEAWLNDTSNIDAMIERSQQSNEFKIAMNIDSNDQSGIKRKIKLS